MRSTFEHLDEDLQKCSIGDKSLLIFSKTIFIEIIFEIYKSLIKKKKDLLTFKELFSQIN